MNIQIFGKAKCFDTKKAQRYFKERNIKFQSVDILDKGLSKGELTSVVNALGGMTALTALVNEKSADFSLFSYLTEENKFDKLLECPSLLKTPIVRNGKAATVGYCPDVWKKWE